MRHAVVLLRPVLLRPPSLVVSCAVVVRDTPDGVACFGGAWPSSWWGVLCWCVAPLMVCPALVVRFPRHCGSCCGGTHPCHGGACCGGVWLPSWWGPLSWYLAPLIVGSAVLVLTPPHCGAFCVAVWPASMWGVLWWCVALLMVGCALLVLDPPPPMGLSVVLCGPPLAEACAVLVRGPFMVGRAAVVVVPHHGRPCCVGAWPNSWSGVLLRCKASLMVGRAVLVWVSVFWSAATFPLRFRTCLARLGVPASQTRAMRQSLVLAGTVKVLHWVVVGAGGLGAGKTSGAGTRGVFLDVVIGGRTRDTDTNGGESSDNRSKVHADCGPAENPSL